MFKAWAAALIFFSSPALAATTIDFNHALELARKQNPELRRAREASQAADWKPLEALGANLPRLQVTGQHLFDKEFAFIQLANGARFDMVQPQTYLTVGTYWTVFDGFQGINAYRGAKRARTAAELEREQAEFAVDSGVRTAFYRALASQALVRVQEENVKSLTDHLAKAQQILKSGASTKFDVLRIRVKFEEVEAELQESRDRLAIAEQELANVLGDDQLVTPVGELPEPKSLSENAAQNLLQSGEVDARAAMLRAEAADLEATSHLGAYVPKLTFFGEKQYYNNVDDSWSGKNFHPAHSVGVLMSWNIFDLSLIARERAGAHAAAVAVADSRLKVLHSRTERETWLRKLRYSQYQYRAKKRAEEYANEELRLARLGFNAGTRTSSDVLDAQVDLFRAQAGRLRAQMDNIEAQGRLEAIFGRSI